MHYSKQLYSKEALLKTAFSFTDHFYLHLSQDEKNWNVEIIPKPDSTVNSLDFENELIRQEIQITVLRNNADLRKLIMARALASTIVDSDSETMLETSSKSEDSFTLPDTKDSDDYSEDVILRSWFDDKESCDI